MTPQLRAALVRSLYIAIPSGLLAALTTWQTTDNLKAIIIAGATAFLTPFVIRFGGEGLYDSSRAQKGQVKVGDVQRLASPLEPQLVGPTSGK